MNFSYLTQLVLLLFATGAAATAAPPNITSLFPAGGQRGTTTEIAAAGSFDSWPVKVWVNGKGVSVEPAKAKGMLKVTVAADAKPGVYWLRAFNEQGASGLRPFLVGQLPETVEKESNDEPATAQFLTGNTLVNGRLGKAGDVDCYAVALKKGQTLVASLDAFEVLRSPMDAILQIVSADGFVLEVNHDFHGLDPLIAFTAPADGTFIVRVFAFPSTPNSSIRFAGGDDYIYRLTLTSAGFADFPLPLAIESDHASTVAIHGWNIPVAAHTLAVPASTAEGTTLFHPTLANSLRLKIEPHACFDFTQKPEQEKPLVPPFSVTSRLDAPGTKASVPFKARKGQSLSLQVKSQELGLAVHPVIRVLDASQKQLGRAEPAKPTSDSALSFNPPVDGDYFAEVRDLISAGGPRHAFLLRVVPSLPDFDLTVASDRLVIAPGKPLELPVKIVRHNGFSRTVDIAVEGAPEGVNWQVKPNTGKADPNLVTLTLSGEKAGTSGPFRIVGRVKEEPRLTRTALATLTEFETTTADLWLTISNTPVATPPPKKKKK